jgi:3-deoxy-D-manno-octulosonate 8-phosphate phosphatase (KDO 8-P phosphatase)
MPPAPIDLSLVSRRISFLLFDCDGVLTDGRIIHGSDGAELKCFSTKDGMGIALWKKAGFPCGCITGRSSEALRKRAEELHFNELFEGVTDKHRILLELEAKYSLSPHQFAYIGDDFNDLPMLGRVGLFLAPADAHPEVLRRADVVLRQNGGRGAVREAIDLLLREKNLMEHLLEQFLA